MFRPKISVIVPIWNAEKHLRACLASLLNQTLSSLEILCIDDASTDSSVQILKELARKDKRLRIFYNKQNKGPGASRQTLLPKARGEYLAFVDADDTLDLNFYETCYKQTDGGKIDVVKAARLYVYADISKTQFSSTASKKTLNEEIRNNLKKEIPLFLSFRSEWQSAIYRRDFVFKNNILFKPFNRCEDTGFLQDILFCQPTFRMIDRPFYHYYQRSCSLTHSLDLHSFKCAILFYMDTLFKIYQFIQQNNDYSLWNNFIYYLQKSFIYYKNNFINTSQEKKYFLLLVSALSLYPFDTLSAPSLPKSLLPLVKAYQENKPTIVDFQKQFSSLTMDLRG